MASTSPEPHMPFGIRLSCKVLLLVLLLISITSIIILQASLFILIPFIAPLPALIPHFTPFPSKAGPAAAEQAYIFPLLFSIISALVPISMASCILSAWMCCYSWHYVYIYIWKSFKPIFFSF